MREWLAANPPPWRLSFFTMPLDGDPSEYTAGQMHFLVHDVAAYEDGGTLTFYRNDGDAHIVLVENALAPGVLEGGAWVGRYANLQTPLDGFQKEVVLVVQKAEEEDEE